MPVIIVILVIIVSIVHAPVLRNAVASERSTYGQHAGAAEGVDVGVQDCGVPENGVDVDLGRKQRGTERNREKSRGMRTLHRVKYRCC
jgi:hypothetical protein